MRHNLAEVGFITEEEYLDREAVADEKHEYLNGFVYRLHADPITNMTGASDAHVKVTGNVHYALKTHLRGSPYSLYMADMRVKIDSKDKAWFYPDVMVTCCPEDRQRDTMKHSPILVIEVLSPSTQDYLLFTGCWLAYVSMCWLTRHNILLKYSASMNIDAGNCLVLKGRTGSLNSQALGSDGFLRRCCFYVIWAFHAVLQSGRVRAALNLIRVTSP